MKFLSLTPEWYLYITANFTSSYGSSSICCSYSWWKISAHSCNFFKTASWTCIQWSLQDKCNSILYVINDQVKQMVIYSSSTRWESHLSSSAQNIKASLFRLKNNRSLAVSWANILYKKAGAMLTLWGKGCCRLAFMLDVTQIPETLWRWFGAAGSCPNKTSDTRTQRSSSQARCCEVAKVSGLRWSPCSRWTKNKNQRRCLSLRQTMSRRSVNAEGYRVKSLVYSNCVI